MSIKTKLILAFFTVAFIPLLTLGLILFQGVKSDMLNTAKNDILTISNSQKKSINTFNRHNVEFIRFISTMPNMGRVADMIINDKDMEVVQDEMRNILDKAMASNKEYEVLFLLHPESGEVISSSQPDMEGMFFNKRKYFSLGKKGPVLYPVHYSLALEKNIMTIAAPVNHIDSLAGVLIAWVNISELTNILILNAPYKSYLLTRSNIHILENTKNEKKLSVLSGIFSEGATRALAGETGSNVYVNHEGYEVAGAYTFIEDLGTALLTEIKREDIVAGANRKARKVLFITLILALLVLSVSVAMGNQIANPIQALTGRIKRFNQTGSDEVSESHEGGKEVLELSSSFDRMLTHRRAVEQALVESERKARAISDTSMDSIIMIDGEGVITYINEATERMLGYSEEELLGRKLHEMLVSKEARHQYYEKLSEFRSSGRCDVVGKLLELMVERKDGARISVEASIAAIKVRGDWYSVGIMRDITERKKSENILRTIAEKISAKTGEDFFKSAALFISQELDMDYSFIGKLEAEKKKVKTVAVCGHGQIIDNIEYELLNTPCSNVIGNESCIYPEHVQQLFPHDELLVQMKVESYAGIPIFGSNAEPLGIIAVLGCSPLKKNMQEQVMSLLKIFASRAASELERIKSEAERSNLLVKLEQKNKELEQVLYVSTHDLRSPLVNIAGFSRELELSLQELDDRLKEGKIPQDFKDKIIHIMEKDIPESLKFILSSTEKMNMLLTALLKLSRIGRLDIIKTRLNMNRLLSSIRDTFEYRLKEDGMVLDITDLPPCTADESQVNQVFSNLIDNAIKYLDSNRSGMIKISGMKDAERAIYCVEDNGIGIASHHKEKIFELFYQLAPGEGRGEGIGLTAIHKILEKLDGKIWVESEPGKGSKFFLSLPA